MKILIFSDFKGTLGDAIRISRIYEHFKKQGHHVELFNMSEHYRPFGKLLKYPSTLLQIPKNILLMKGKNQTKYLTYEHLCRKFIIQQLKKHKPDILWTESIIPSFIATQVLETLGLKDKIHHFSDIHGLASAEYIENQFIKHEELHYEYLISRESGVFEKSGYLVVVSTPMKEYIQRKFNTKAKIIIVPNGADFQNQVAKYTTPLKIIYGGIFAFWEDVDSYLDLAKMRNGAEEFYLVGKGPLEQHLLDRIHKEKIKVRFLGSMKKPDALKLFSQMSIGIAPSVATLTRKVASPIKVFDYLACGLPVITPNVGEWSEIVKTRMCGIVTEKSSGEEFAKAIDILKDGKRWKELSKNGINLIKKAYNWDVLLKVVDKELVKLRKKYGYAQI